MVLANIFWRPGSRVEFVTDPAKTSLHATLSGRQFKLPQPLRETARALRGPHPPLRHRARVKFHPRRQPMRVPEEVKHFAQVGLGLLLQLLTTALAPARAARARASVPMCLPAAHCRSLTHSRRSGSRLATSARAMGASPTGRCASRSGRVPALCSLAVCMTQCGGRPGNFKRRYAARMSLRCARACACMAGFLLLTGHPLYRARARARRAAPSGCSTATGVGVRPTNSAQSAMSARRFSNRSPRR